jgi:hypothetical protein
MPETAYKYSCELSVQERKVVMVASLLSRLDTGMTILAMALSLRFWPIFFVAQRALKECIPNIQLMWECKLIPCKNQWPPPCSCRVDWS